MLCWKSPAGTSVRCSKAWAVWVSVRKRPSAPEVVDLMGANDTSWRQCGRCGGARGLVSPHHRHTPTQSSTLRGPEHLNLNVARRSL